MNILGIDLSLTGTGLAVLTTDGLFPANSCAGKPAKAGDLGHCFYYTWLLNRLPEDQAQRWQAILFPIMNLARQVDQIVIENYAFNATFRLAPIAELGGIVRFHLARQGFKPLMIAPKTLKKFVTGNGNAKKDLVIAGVKYRYHVDLDNDNLADAFGLAKIGEAMISTEGLPQFQVEIINALKAPKVKESKRRKTA